MQFSDIIHKSTRSVGVICNMSFAAREFPDEPAVNRTENQVASFSFCSCTFNVIENPFDFRAGEISINDKTRLLLELVNQAFFLEVFADRSRLTGLPYDCVINRTARVLIPNNSGFALVRDTDCCDIAGSKTGLLKSFLHNCRHAAPDLICIMLNPARVREILREFLLGNTNDFGVLVEDDCSVARSTCIQRHYILFSHFNNPPLNFALIRHFHQL